MDVAAAIISLAGGASPRLRADGDSAGRDGKSMTKRDDLKSACDVTVGFPHDGDFTPSQRLRAVADFLDAKGWAAEETYLDGPVTRALEAETARWLGTEAAIWFPTGTMAQSAAARIHAAETGRSTLLLHPSSHLELHEDHGYREAHKLQAELTPDWRAAVTARDVEAAGSDLATVIIELPQRHAGGLLPSWDELEAIKAACRARGARLHIDGARLWTCTEAYEGRPLADICAGADSVYVSFYKDIGALGGAALAGSADFIEEARVWRHRLGGLVIRGWPQVPDALRLLPERTARMPDYVARARELSAAIRDASGFEIEPEVPRTNMFHVRMPMDGDTVAKARDHAARETGVWLANRFWDYEAPAFHSAELSVGDRIMAIPVKRIAMAFAAMAEYGGKA